MPGVNRTLVGNKLFFHNKCNNPEGLPKDLIHSSLYFPLLRG